MAPSERELRASLAELGVDDVRVLDYRDGECDLVDEAAIAEITAQIDGLRPDVVLGHGELLYATMTDEFVARIAELRWRRAQARRSPGTTTTRSGRTCGQQSSTP